MHQRSRRVRAGAVQPPFVALAALFGAGWGLEGYCPGPALTSSVAGAPLTLIFTAAMLFGMGAFAAWGRLRPPM